MTRWDELYPRLLREVCENGALVHPSKGDAREIVARTFSLDDPRDRCLMNEARKFNVFQAIGHWLWVMAGRMDLPSIQYYNKIASQFSADQRKLDGAYGPRLFGLGVLNQIPNIIQLIKERPNTRRALATVYIPEFDSHRVIVEGREDEVPCTVALQFLPREKKLHSVVMMRSQEVANVLPYDVFIFTLIQEFVARSVNLELGTYVHFAGSFHVYEKDRTVIEAICASLTRPGPLLPAMPPGDQSSHLKRVHQLESNIRNDADIRLRVPGKSVFRPKQYIEEAGELPSFWSNIVYALVAYAAIQLKDLSVLRELHRTVDPSLRSFVERALVLAKGPQIWSRFGMDPGAQ